MILIWGFKDYLTQLAVLFATCNFCRHQGGQVIRRRTRKFTFFFIPLFTTSTRYTQQCAFCAAESEISAEQADWATRQANIGSDRPDPNVLRD